MVTTDSVALPRIDAREKVTGQAVYTEDLPLPFGAAYCATLGSPYSHARIRSVDAEKAERLPGVLAVLTREHLEGMDPHVNVRGRALGDFNQTFIAIDKVRYEGEPVAAVAAESRALAQHALTLIEVEYEELPAVFDPRDAIALGAPVLHENAGREVTVVGEYRLEETPGSAVNVVGEYQKSWGEVDQGFRESDHIFEDEYVYPRSFHYPMENIGGCVAEFRSDRVELLAPIQHMYDAQEAIASLFGLEPEQVFIRMPYVGGGFGSKDLKVRQVIALWMARKTGRPVYTIPSAEESMRSDARHQMVHRVKTGVKADGTLWAQEINILADEGAYAHALGVLRFAVTGAWGAYRIPHVRAQGRSVFTNCVPAGSFRDLARTQVVWAYESHYDNIAREMGIDPMEFRIKNFMRRGDMVTKEATPLDADYDILLRQAAEAIGWDGRSTRVGPAAAKPAAGAKPVRGRGLSTTFRHGYSGGANDSAVVTIDTQGKAKILHSGAEIGMGLYSVLSRVAAETLGISQDQITVSHPNSEQPRCDGVSGSRNTVCLGMAVQNACEDLRQELTRVAALTKGGDIEEWRLIGGRLWRGEQDYSLGEIVAALGRPKGTILGKGSYISPARANEYSGAVPHWEVSVAAAEVEVDPDTGEIRLLKYANVCDVGKAILPGACKGQLEGGAVMGMGDALFEETVYGDGQFLNGDPLQYRLPALHDTPEGFHSVIVENGDGPGPQGSKGMGQTAVSPVAPAIGNAIFEAVGVRINDLPITPEKILRALGRL